MKGEGYELYSFYEGGIVNNSKNKMLFISNEVSIKYKEKKNNESVFVCPKDKRGKMLVGNNAGNTCYTFREYAEGKEDKWHSKMRT